MPKQLSNHRLNIITAAFVLIAFMLGCNEFMVVGNLTPIANTYHESLTRIAGLISIFAWTYAFMTPVVTLYTNRFNKYRLLMVLMGIFLVGTIISAFSPTYPCFLVSRMITASVAGVLESLIQAIVFEIAPTQKKQSMMTALVYSGFSVASVMGLPIGTLIADYWRWQDAFVMVAIITAIAMVVTSLLVPRQLAMQSSGIKNQLTLLGDRDIWLGIVFTTCAAATLYGYYTYIRPLIRQTLGFSTGMLSWILVLLGVMDILSTLASGKLGERNGMQRLRVCYVIILILLALFAPAMQKAGTGLAMLLLLGLIVPIFSAPVQLYFLNIATERHPAGIMLASSLSAIFYNVGIAISSLTAAKVLGRYGLVNLGWNSFAYALVALVLLVVISQRLKKAHD
ncbi:MFS transporter [Limosilactobacillus sp.]|jgi:predicted MFS family arabinose efflux permease|uniref:MFS transporter n=1 Tax=Limosilactobacillus sp. TaxID=2773925 RepID=UPI0025BF572A|nr:MFS transporter [Limosilactobacillus sp.]MCH3921851.1 MFS transporter [Limosilactobacillus sp.]MCH3928622.1 MFS transporter [Limosilactobacillus sp.]